MLREKKAKRRRWCLFGLALAALLFCVLTLFFQKDSPHGHLRVMVLDAYTLVPVPDALVLLPESGISGYTDAQGCITLFNIPVVYNAAQSATLAQDWGETSLLVYKEGYRSYALFYVHVPEGKVRIGPTIYLFPDNEEYDGPITVIEAPDDDWVEELLEKYA